MRLEGSAHPRGHRSLSPTWYPKYVLSILTLCYVVNVMDRSQLLAASLQAIKQEFGASDFQLGMLTGIPFAVFYSLMGIPIAAWADRSSRRNLLSAAVTSWSVTTALFGLATSYPMLFVARVGTAIGEAGGTPASQSLIADYFSKDRRGTAFSVYALAVPLGTAVGAAFGGWGNQVLGWRLTFVVAGVAGVALGAVVWLTVREPSRGYSEATSRMASEQALPMPHVVRLLWSRPSFRHLCAAAALHSVAWYASGAFNNAFLQRSHDMTAAQAGYWISVFAVIAGAGTMIGGLAADRASARRSDQRWYLWVPCIATVLCVPCQLLAYLSPSSVIALPALAGLMFAAAAFFGPSFATTQALATTRMRALAPALLLLFQTLFGSGLGPALTGILSDSLMPPQAEDSLAYALAVTGLFNVWAAMHYWLGARTLEADIAYNENSILHCALGRV